VSLVPLNSVLFADPAAVASDDGRSTRVLFRPLEGSWRAKSKPHTSVQRGSVLQFLSPLGPELRQMDREFDRDDPPVILSKDVRQYLLPFLHTR
jgi:hypothetical protein